MLNSETKQKIDSARDILVGNVTNPISQVDQITNALIYKFMDDMDQENLEVDLKPQFFIDNYKQYSWRKLMDKRLSGQERFNLYEEAIKKLSDAKHIPALFRTIFENARLPYNDPRVLTLFLKEINGFSYSHSEELGNSFEYLLSILGSQGDAGQFRTPRHIIDFIAEVVDPKKNETILDPACGTAGFLISAYKHILKAHDGLDNKTGKPTNKEINLTPNERTKLMNSIVGYDISPDMVKLSLVNMYLHGFQNPQIYKYDSLSSEERWGEQFDVIMANPPFMTPKGGIKPHKRFSIQANRSEVLFVDYIMEHLSIKGRAGIIVPEGIIFKGDKAYKALRKKLVEDGLFAVVSLPAGVFQPYSGVKTSVLFFDNQLAKKSDDILFVKIENDGFDLGAQRRKIDKNDLPKALELISKYKESLNNKDISLTGLDVRENNILLVSKNEISESGDYNLTGDRYKIDIYVGLQNITQNLEKIFEPHKKILNKIQKQIKTEPYRKLAEQLQKQEKQANRIFASPMFQEAQKSMQKIAERMQKAFKDIDFQQISKEREELKKELKNRQKWEMVELGEVCEFKNGLWKGKKEPFQTIKIIRNTNFSKKGELNLTDVAEHPVETKQLETRKLKSGDIVLENSGGGPTQPVGRVIYFNVNDNDIYSWSNFTSRIRVIDKRLDSKYLFHVLNNFYQTGGTENLQRQTSGIRNLEKKVYQKIKIPLPPLEVQKEIVEQIEVKQNAINHAREIIKSLERERQYFGQELKQLENVEWVELREVCEFNPKKSEIKDTSKEQLVSFIPMADLNENQISFETKQEKEIKDVYSGYTYFAENDVLLARVTPCFENGKAGIARNLINRIGFGSSEYFIFRANLDKVLPEFIYYFIASYDFVENGKNNMSGTGGLQRLTKDYVTKYKIPLPPLEIQKQLVAEAEKEEEIIRANKNLIEIMERKIEKVIENYG